jgi:hypothetical protein
MAFRALRILKELAPLIVQAGAVAAGLRSSGSAVKEEDRVERLERETVRAGEVLAGVAEQLQAIALELRAQAEATEALRKKVNVCLIVAGVALAVAIMALVMAVAR